MDEEYEAALVDLLLHGKDGTPDPRLDLLYKTNPEFKNGIDLMVRITPQLVAVIAADSERSAKIRGTLLRIAEIGAPDLRSFGEQMGHPGGHYG